mmetsp:Transcript_9743/g.25549  ORF Transcript_9743/g.25549 Transcript_9743/m.25549 type:complete len:326 (+) Transcript_9743:851-1828(+)
MPFFGHACDPLRFHELDLPHRALGGDGLSYPCLRRLHAMMQLLLCLPALRQEVGGAPGAFFLQLRVEAFELLAKLFPMRFAFVVEGLLLLANEVLASFAHLILRHFKQLPALPVQCFSVPLVHLLLLLFPFSEDPLHLGLQSLDGHFLDLAYLVLLPCLPAEPLRGHPILFLARHVLGGLLVELFHFHLELAFDRLELLGKQLATLRKLRFVVQQPVDQFQMAFQASFVMRLLLLQFVIPLFGDVLDHLFFVGPGILQSTLEHFDDVFLVADFHVEQRHLRLPHDGFRSNNAPGDISVHAIVLGWVPGWPRRSGRRDKGTYVRTR